MMRSLKLISIRTSNINQTRGLLSEYGVIIPVGLMHFAHSLPRLIDPADTRISLRMKHQLIEVKDEYDTLSERCLSIDKQLKAYVNENPLCQRLMTLPGVGFINATALYASIGNACQFAKPRELSVWLGVPPRQDAYGEKSYNAGITKRGNQYLRKQLIHGAHSFIGRKRNMTSYPSA